MPLTQEHRDSLERWVKGGMTLAAAHRLLRENFDDVPGVSTVYNHMPHLVIRKVAQRTFSQLDRLAEVDRLLGEVNHHLDVLDRKEITLSITEAKASIARGQAWVADAITCVRVDKGLDVPSDADED